MVSLVTAFLFSGGLFFVYICNMNINDIYLTISYMVDKYQGSYLSPDDFNLAINTAQRQYLNFLTGETAEFSQGRSGKTIGGFSNDVTTGGSLSTFLKETTLTPNSTTGLVTQPTDFYKISAVRTSDDDNAVRRVGADKVFAYVGNAIDPPTTTEPIYTELGNTFKFYPSSVGPVKIIYFKIPAEAQWVATVGTLNYDNAASTQLEWPLNDINDIIYRTLGIIGINLKDGDLMRVSQTVKNDGQ